MFSLPDLAYDYDALGKYISKDIMQLHHSKHHQTYVDKLNTALDDAPALRDRPIESLLGDIESLPQDVQMAIRNNGGGHYNHSLFWQWMSPDGGGQPNGPLAAAIADTYGDFQSFTDAFTASALGVFGSGWVWLQPDMSLATTANQDNPLMSGQASPLLGLDVWEHAYYLDYKNKRTDYVDAWWNVVDWNVVSERFSKSVTTD